jgi:hypothetical protein
VHSREPIPNGFWKTFQDDPDVGLGDRMPPITPRRMSRELELSHGVRIDPSQDIDRFAAESIATRQQRV